jgi:DNA-directed RNA polymerase specialized sigma24 family protein
MDDLNHRFGAWLASLSDRELKELWNKLRYFTYFHFSWLPPKVPGGLELEDLIEEAIEDALSGQRTWPEGLDPFSLLCGTIRSKASHVWEKVKRRRPGAEGSSSPADGEEAALPPPPDDDEGEAIFQFGASGYKADYYHLCQNVQRDADCYELRDRILALIGDRPLERAIVELRMDDPKMTPRDLAAVLRVPFEEVRRAVRRLQKIVATLRKEYGR